MSDDIKQFLETNVTQAIVEKYCFADGEIRSMGDIPTIMADVWTEIQPLLTITNNHSDNVIVKTISTIGRKYAYNCIKKNGGLRKKKNK